MAESSGLSQTRILVAYALLKGSRRSKVLRLAIDTGAVITIIPVEAAISIGRNPAKSARKVAIVTASSLEYLPVITIPQIVSLGQRVRSMSVACHDLPPQSTVDGLLGLDFLNHVPAFKQFHRAILELTQE